jgi:uncharacterized repeat protein (TIGR03803 family)
MQRSMLPRLVSVRSLLIASALLICAVVSASAQFSTLYTFDSPRTSDNSVPNSPPVIDSQGNLYGTVTGNADGNVGGVYELTPSGDGTWTESFYEMTNSLPADGIYPIGLFFDNATGNLYGTARGGTGGCGVVYQLMPPTAGSGTWTETVLYAFPSLTGDVCDAVEGDGPLSPLIADANGNLYGAAFSGGTNDRGVVFKLSPPSNGSGPWTEQVLYNFQGGNLGGDPSGGLIMDSKGALYGTTEWVGAVHGTVFKLTPTKSGVWSYQVLHKFTADNDGLNPESQMVFDSAGALYGVTGAGGNGCTQREAHIGCGIVFQLVPPSTQGAGWTENILYEFTGQDDGAWPVGGIFFNSTGALIGCTAGAGSNEGGTLYELTPPSSGTGPWTITPYSLSQGRGCQGITPSGNNLYGTTFEGGANRGGIVFDFVR